MLKLNDNNFNIEAYQYISDIDLKFLIDMFIDEKKYKEFENQLEQMIRNGNEEIVDLIL